MPLAPGTRIGSHDIVALIGAGGMGEVYRARDARLGRDVAIKIVSPSIASDADGLMRFDREARVLASLNHPNIASIYGVDDNGGAPALILELVDGETLADRIAQGPVPVAEALGYARQIAEALDAAHERGVVHRDLKPANIKITEAGTVKVLDFGLAKAIAAASAPDPASDPADSPTITVKGTRHNVILGTAAYMSPEQARGKSIDKRTDIWAFGCVIYEMLTGRRTFGGETTSDVIAAIIEREPDLAKLPAATPPQVRRLIERCLQKDPKQRLRDIADARIDLQPAAEARERSDTAGTRSVHLWRGAAVLAVGAALVLAVNAWRDRPPRQLAAAPQLTRLTSDIGLTTEPSLSADGRIVAYASDRASEGNLDIWVQQTAGGGAVRLTTDPTDDRSPDISPDGTQIAFRSDRGAGGIYIIPALGGDARLIAPEGRAPKFSPDGRSLAFWTGGWLAARGQGAIRHTYVIDANGGTPRPIATELANSGDAVWSPDGNSLLLYGRKGIAAEDDNAAHWWIAPVNGGPARVTGAFAAFQAAGLEVTNPDVQPIPGQWTRDGVVFAATTRDRDIRSIWRIDLDPESGEVRRPPQQLTFGTTFDERPFAARDGMIGFAALARRRLILGLPLDANAGRPTGEVTVIRSDVADTARATVSEDGNVVAFARYDRDSGSVWVRDIRAGRERQLATTRRTPLNPIISRDARWVAYTVTTVDQGGASGAGTGFVMSTEGGSPRKICDDCELYQWSRSNRFVIGLRRPDIQLIDAQNGTATPIVTADRRTPAGEREAGQLHRPLLSYDERFFSFTRRTQVYVAPFSTSRPIEPREWQPVLTLERQAERVCGWSPDGRLLYLLLERDGFRCLYAVRIDPATGRGIGDPFLVAHIHHGAREWGSTGFNSAVVNGLFVFNQVGLSGNLWTLR